jgi:glycosyltransferase involved in cell wall biosynthesis
VGSGLAVNLSMLMARPTGISTYALNLFPELRTLEPTLLMADGPRDRLGNQLDRFRCAPVPGGMTSEQGSLGHCRRLLWTQTCLPSLYRKLDSNLLFSPVPEAPLWSGCRTVVMAHDLIPLRFPKRRSPLSAYFRLIVPQVLAQATHIICNSESTARDVHQFFGVPAAKLSPIPLAYDADHFRPLGLPRGNYLLYLGRPDPYKNLDRLLQAFAQVQGKLGCELWICGSQDPRYTPALRRLIRHLGIEAQVKIIDYLPYGELPRVIGQAIGLVFPSLWEGFGLPVLEAMACGTPVITSNLSSLPEVTGDAALLVDPYRVEALAAAMVALVTEPGLQAQLQATSLARAAQFSWRATGRATAAILGGLL